MKTIITIISILTLFVFESSAQTRVNTTAPAPEGEVKFKMAMGTNLGNSDEGRTHITFGDGVHGVRYQRHRGWADITLKRGVVASVVLNNNGRKIQLQADGIVGPKTKWKDRSGHWTATVVVRPTPSNTAGDPHKAWIELTVEYDPGVAPDRGHVYWNDL